MTTLKWLASVSLAIATSPAMHAELYYPGNVTSLRLRLVQRSLIRCSGRDIPMSLVRAILAILTVQMHPYPVFYSVRRGAFRQQNPW